MAFNPTGKEFLDPEALLKLAGIKPRMTVADLGAGSGFFAFTASQLITDDGKVYLVDILKEVLRHLMTEAKHRGIHNFFPVWSNLEIYGAAKAVSNNSVNLAWLVNTLYENQDNKHEQILKEAVRMIKPKGRLLIIDWQIGLATPFGPADDRRVDPKKIASVCQNLNLKLINNFTAGKFHFGLLFEK